MTAAAIRVPRWFEPGNRYAGALDKVCETGGLFGWVVDLSDLERHSLISVKFEGQVIARGDASDARPDFEWFVGTPVDCGFNIGWGQFDISAVRAVVESTPGAIVEIHVDDLGILLSAPSVAESTTPLTAVDLWDYIKNWRSAYKTGKTPGNQLFTECNPSKISNADVDILLYSEFLDEKLYSQNPGIYGSHSTDGPLIAHYLSYGEINGFKPNAFFDPSWYTRKYLPSTSREGALRHYVDIGERKGYKPCSVFEPEWYRGAYLSNSNYISPLAHFLKHKNCNKFNPNKYFDLEYYFKTNKDVADGGLDGFSHWLDWGIFEGRSGSPNFNAEYVWSRYLGNNRQVNPFEKFMDIGVELGWEPTPAAYSSVHRAAAESSESGAMFERLQPFSTPRADATKVVAMYLPQFHAIPENDAWWGEGFTEWRNLMRALPRYVGHIQPRIPRDLGFYELVGSRTMRRQIELAKHAGLQGFCYYYYNFNGRRLLEQPIETFLRETDIDFPFCILWANENWTRRWDGMDQEVLIQQNYREEDAPELVADIARHMKDRRYIRSAEGRPYFFIYRADVIPDCAQMLERWRDLFRTEHALDPLFFICQTFGFEDPRPFGADGALEFPPHKLTNTAPLLNPNIELLDPEFSGQVFGYKDIVQASLLTLDAEYPLIKTAFPNWDNSARRQTKAMSIANSTPQAFEAWMAKLIRNAEAKRYFGCAMVFVNAWNEWCEGAYLEPDTHFGFAYLNALRRALADSVREIRQIVLIGHDAFPAGAQHLLLALGKLLKRQFGLEVKFVLLDGGALVGAYREIAETFVASDARGDAWADLRARLSDLFRQGYRYAVCNTVAAGGATAILEDLKFDFCSLVHELPTVMRSRSLTETYAAQRERGHAVVYPNMFVKNALDAEFGDAGTRATVIPQGLYNIPVVPDDARVRVREALGLPEAAEIVLSIGYGDFRKGVDLFLSLAEQMITLRPNAYFVWLGDIHPDLAHWLPLDIEHRGLRNVLLLPFDRDIGRYLGAADVFVSTSREDPFPSVVLEALSVGIPVVAFRNTGGHAEFLAEDPRLGVLAPYADVHKSASLILDALERRVAETHLEAEYRRVVIAEKFDFAKYGARLIKLIEPSYVTVSVIIPNYNYATYLPERMDSVYKQNFPVFETFVLDDASSDESLQVAHASAVGAKRTIAVRPNAINSGSPFRQWKAGLEEVQGEFVWIAEADDSSQPRFLSEAIRRLSASPDAAFCFTDSQAIDAGGATIYHNYKGYYSEYGDLGLEQDGCFSGKEFLRRFLTIRNLVVNVSAVVWRTEALRQVFHRLGDEAFSLRCAGDWRIYIEACRLGRDILYISDTLNKHRRHDQSVTGSLDRIDHLKEIEVVQNFAMGLVGIDDTLQTSAAKWRAKTARDWNVAPMEE